MRLKPLRNDKPFRFISMSKFGSFMNAFVKITSLSELSLEKVYVGSNLYK